MSSAVVTDEKKTHGAIETKTVIIRCHNCGKKHFEITGWVSFRYLFRCTRCAFWNTRDTATNEKPLTEIRPARNPRN